MEARIEKQRHCEIPFSGMSMWPFLKSGDVLQVSLESIPLAQIPVGEIIVYKEDDEWVAHRVVGREDRDILIKGDWSNNLSREPETREVLGFVEGVRRGQKYTSVSEKNKASRKALAVLSKWAFGKNRGIRVCIKALIFFLGSLF